MRMLRFDSQNENGFRWCKLQKKNGIILIPIKRVNLEIAALCEHKACKWRKGRQRPAKSANQNGRTTRYSKVSHKQRIAQYYSLGVCTRSFMKLEQAERESEKRNFLFWLANSSLFAN